MKCTWENCSKEGRYDHAGNIGNVWAMLCDEHHEKLNAAITSGVAPRILSAWVKAQGGAKAAAERMKYT